GQCPRRRAIEGEGGDEHPAVPDRDQVLDAGHGLLLEDLDGVTPVRGGGPLGVAAAGHRPAGLLAERCSFLGGEGCRLTVRPSVARHRRSSPSVSLVHSVIVPISATIRLAVLPWVAGISRVGRGRYCSVMAYDEELADRIRELVSGEKRLTEKKMCGGLAFLVGGNMAVAASGQGGILVRVDPDQSPKLVSTTAAAPMGSP